MSVIMVGQKHVAENEAIYHYNTREAFRFWYVSYHSGTDKRRTWDRPNLATIYQTATSCITDSSQIVILKPVLRAPLTLGSLPVPLLRQPCMLRMVKSTRLIYVINAFYGLYNLSDVIEHCITIKVTILTLTA